MTATRTLSPLAAVALLVSALAGAPADPPAKTPESAYPFVFKDVGDDAGLFPHVGGIRGHGAAWGDADGDGFPELYVGTFQGAGSRANLFFRNEKGKFKLDAQKPDRKSVV